MLVCGNLEGVRLPFRAKGSRAWLNCPGRSTTRFTRSLHIRDIGHKDASAAARATRRGGGEDSVDLGQSL